MVEAVGKDVRANQPNKYTYKLNKIHCVQTMSTRMISNHYCSKTDFAIHCDLFCLQTSQSILTLGIPRWGKF